MTNLRLPKFNIGKFLLFTIATFIFIALLSWLLNAISPKLAFFTEPSIPLLFLTILVAGVIPFTFFVNDGKLNRKDWVGLLIYAATILLLLTILPERFPQAFGENIVLSDFLDSLKLWQSVLGMP